jgi:hypothetical protein
VLLGLLHRKGSCVGSEKPRRGLGAAWCSRVWAHGFTHEFPRIANSPAGRSDVPCGKRHSTLVACSMAYAGIL